MVGRGRVELSSDPYKRPVLTVERTPQTATIKVMIANIIMNYPAPKEGGASVPISSPSKTGLMPRQTALPVFQQGFMPSLWMFVAAFSSLS